jgi:hypothetical protein
MARVIKQGSRLSAFCQIETAERTLSLTLDIDKKETTSRLDGCYVIQTELDQEAASTEVIHQRYKDLAFVEQGFRTMKSAKIQRYPRPSHSPVIFSHAHRTSPTAFSAYSLCGKPQYHTTTVQHPSGGARALCGGVPSGRR